MRFVAQSLDDIINALQPLTVDWRDDVALRVIAKLESLELKTKYQIEDIQTLLDDEFDEALLIFRLFLGLSKDQFQASLSEKMGNGGMGVLRYRRERDAFVDALVSLGVVEAMSSEVNRIPRWSDVLVERLRSGRGSAISGQKRGRGVEDFTEALVKKVFGDKFDTRCNFIGQRGASAKCDFAIPSKAQPNIVIEAKGYGATGSKMTDVIGDIEKIITAKRPDTAFLFMTDGLTWRQRVSDLRTIVGYQNAGDITRIYTSAMAEQFEEDLVRLKAEYQL